VHGPRRSGVVAGRPVRLVHTIRELQEGLASLAVTNPWTSPPSSKSLNEFLHELAYLWHEGEVRATHRKEPASGQAVDSYAMSYDAPVDSEGNLERRPV